MRYAGFWLRFCAAIIDGIVVNIIGIIAGFAIGLSIGIIVGDAETAQALAGVLGSIAGIVIAWLYCSFMESSPKQATLGKQALGIKVTNLDGKPISFFNATGRHFAKYLSILILLIGYIMAAFTSKRQALHDMVAGSLVLKN